MLERGVRFVQVWSGMGGASRNWDNHSDIPKELPFIARSVERWVWIDEKVGNELVDLSPIVLRQRSLHSLMQQRGTPQILCLRTMSMKSLRIGLGSPFRQ